MGFLDRIAPRRSDVAAEPIEVPANDELLHTTKALRKFLTSVTARECPTLLDLGPVIGSNVSFFGEQLGCKVFIEDVYGSLERHLREGAIGELPAFLSGCLRQPDGAIDGVLCWDLLDYLDRASAQALADQLTRVLRPEGVLLGFFATALVTDAHYTKFVIADESNLKYRNYPASRGRQGILANRDVIRLFPGLRVSDSFLMKNNVREILFRKPAYDLR